MSDENGKSKSGDWGMKMPHLRFDKDKGAADISSEFKPNSYSGDQPRAEDWEIIAPKQDTDDGWSMPSPVFRVSEGEKVSNLPKRTLNFERTEANDYDKAPPNLNLSELSPPYPYGAGSVSFDSPSGISETIIFNSTATTFPKKEKAFNSNLIYGLVLVLFLAIIILAGVYFLFINNRLD